MRGKSQVYEGCTCLLLLVSEVMKVLLVRPPSWQEAKEVRKQLGGDCIHEFVEDDMILFRNLLK